MPQRFATLAATTLTAATAASLALLATTPAVAHAAPERTARTTAQPPMTHAAGAHAGAGDSLTVTVAHAGAGSDGTYRLVCTGSRSSSPGSTHPDPAGACARLAELAAAGTDPFVPPAGQERTMCTMIYGGPATAHVSGTWQGRPVSADFRRTNGCEVSRWNSLVPVLPVIGPGAAGRGAAGTGASVPGVNTTAGSALVG